MFVCERMAKNLVTASPGTSLREARKLMLDYKIRHLPVVNGNGLLARGFGDAFFPARPGRV